MVAHESRDRTASPTRLYMENTILPAIVALKPGRLDVGLDTYTQHYYRWFPTGCAVLDHRHPPQGRPLREGAPHITGDVLDIEDDFAPASLDVVMLNGAFGVRDRPAVRTTAGG